MTRPRWQYVYAIEVRHADSNFILRAKEAKLFRNNRSQAVRIPVEFELPGDRVLIHREGDKLIIEPVRMPTTIVELLAAWRQEPPLGPDDQFPDIEDPPVRPEGVF